MAEQVFLHGHFGRNTVQVVYDRDRGPLPYAGRVLDVNGETVYQSDWFSGNAPAVSAAEAWARNPPPAAPAVTAPAPTVATTEVPTTEVPATENAP